MLEENVYNNRDNTVELALYVNQSLLTHNTITRAIIQVGSTQIDSATQPTWFDFTHADRIIFKLGSAGLSAGGQVGRIVIYDDTYTGGVVWGEIKLLVHD